MKTEHQTTRPHRHRTNYDQHTYSLAVESSTLVWLLLTFTAWAGQDFEIEHGFLLRPSKLKLTTEAGKLLPHEMRWLVADVLRSSEGELTLRSDCRGRLTRLNAGEFPRRATIGSLVGQARLFLEAHGIAAEAPTLPLHCRTAASRRTVSRLVEETLRRCAAVPC